MVFGAIYDRYKLSSYNQIGEGDNCPWYDWLRGELFCVFSQQELAEIVGCSERTVRRALDALRDADVIDWRKASYKGANRYYVHEHIRNYLKAQ